MARFAVQMAAHQQRMGRLLAEARAEAGLTQEEAARRIGVGNRTYQKWEGGEVVPYRRNLLKAGDVFGKTVEQLGGEPLEDYIEDQLDRIEEKLDRLLARVPRRPGGVDPDPPAPLDELANEAEDQQQPGEAGR